MIYSTFAYDDRKYTYWEAPGTPPATGSFRMPGAAMLPESLLARLPSGARQVGTGDMPKGVIATTDGALAGLAASADDGGGFPFMKVAGALAVGFVVGRWVRR